MIAAACLSAQEIKFDSDTISGLGARNIGSAQMSGRVTSLAAVRENGRLTRLRRIGQRRSVEIGERRNHVQARVRQAAGAIHRRDRD